MEQEPETVVLEIAEGEADALDPLDQQVAAQDVRVGTVHEPLVETLLGLETVLGAVEQAQVLGGDPRQPDLLVDAAGFRAGEQPIPSVVGEVLMPPSQDPPDPVRRVLPPPAVAGAVLLDTAADVIDSGEAPA